MQHEEKDTIIEVIAIPATKTQKKAFYETAERLKKFRERTKNDKIKKLTQLSRERLNELLETVNAELDEMERSLLDDRQAV